MTRVKIAKNLLLKRSCAGCGRVHSMGKYYVLLTLCDERKTAPKEKVCAEWKRRV